jgi:hypothetical protein
MSLPTVYEIFNDNGDVLGHCQTQVWSWFPVSKKGQPEEFAAEAAGLLLDDISPYCAGQQARTPNPKFKLEDVAALTSSGGSLARSEFPAALKCLAARMIKTAEYLRENEAGAETETEIAEFFEPRARAALTLAETFNQITTGIAKVSSAAPNATKPAP